VYYTWLYYVSYFRYAYEVLVTNELEGLKFSCLPSDPACIPTGTSSSSSSHYVRFSFR
jgi:hypothetical protein